MIGFYYMCGFLCTLTIAGVIFFHYQDKKEERKQEEG